MVKPFVFLRVRSILTIYLVGASQSVKQALETMREHPQLLREFFNQVSHLYHPYCLAL